MRTLFSWILKVLIYITLPIWLPIAIFALVTEVYFIPHELVVRSAMRSASRWLRRSELRGYLQRGIGTLIVDWPTPGWRFSRAWWTPDSIDVESMQSLDGVRLRDKEFELHLKYTDLEKGRAFLIAVWWGAFIVDRLRRRFPGIAVVELLTFFPQQWIPQESQEMQD